MSGSRKKEPGAGVHSRRSANSSEKTSTHPVSMPEKSAPKRLCTELSVSTQKATVEKRMVSTMAPLTRRAALEEPGSSSSSQMSRRTRSRPVMVSDVNEESGKTA